MSKRIEEYIEEIKIIDDEVIALEEELSMITEKEEYAHYEEEMNTRFRGVYLTEQDILKIEESDEGDQEYIEPFEKWISTLTEEKEIVENLLEREREQGRGDL